MHLRKNYRSTNSDSSDFSDPLTPDDGVVTPALESTNLPADGTVWECALLLDTLPVYRTLRGHPATQDHRKPKDSK